MAKKKRGFATLSPERQLELARKGGRAAQDRGVAHKFTPEEAKRAGQLGGLKVSEDRKHMQEIGRRGGLAKRLPICVSLPVSEAAILSAGSDDELTRRAGT